MPYGLPVSLPPYRVQNVLGIVSFESRIQENLGIYGYPLTVCD